MYYALQAGGHRFDPCSSHTKNQPLTTLIRGKWFFICTQFDTQALFLDFTTANV